MSVSSDRALSRLQARVINPAALPREFEINTDTRALRAGQTYLALRGERFNGHAFTRDAVAAGAAALIVSDAEAVPPGVAAVIVEDTLAAFMNLAALARESFQGTLMAITGSAGKTTTKDFIAQILESAFPGRVRATPENENNEIGVSKLLLGLDTHARFAVVEMGARHYRDIAPLVRIAAPHVAVLTNISEAHLEIMGSFARLAETKWDIFSSGALPVVNIDDRYCANAAKTLSLRPHFFGLGENRLLSHETRFMRSVIALPDREIQVIDESPTAPPQSAGNVPARVVGRHNLANAAAAVAAALAAGIELDAIREALGTLHLPRGRYERIEIAGMAPLIYDAYNASPNGMLATLATFSLEPARRRIAVLASMAELGEGAQRLHRSVGVAAAHAQLDVVLLGGEHADDLEWGLRAEDFGPEKIVRFASNHEAAAWLAQHATPEDIVLLKGARRYKLEEIVEELRAMVVS